MEASQVTWPSSITAEDAPALDALAAAGVGEGDFDDHGIVPAWLLELYEVLEWQAAVEGGDRRGAGEPRTLVELAPGLPLVTRAEWGARPARSRTGLAPTFGTTVHWEGPTMGAFPHTSCATKVRGIQAFHMDQRQWQDIAYTALVCPHGYVFEGRWLNTRTAANGTTQGNDTAYAACYLGGSGDPFTAAGRAAMLGLLDFLDVHGAGPRRNAHRDWKATECPGDEITAWVRTVDRPAPVPAPTPTVPGTEVPVRQDIMIVTDGKPVAWLFGDKVIELANPEEMAQLQRIGVPGPVKLSRKVYEDARGAKAVKLS